jgi:signal transduction histidine kinase
MTEQTHRQLELLSDYLATRHEAILLASRSAEEEDPEQSTVHALTRAQFSDHIPQILQAFEKKLRSRPGERRTVEADEQKKTEEIKHGLHRWQQGYRLRELVQEWGHLHRCVFDEVEKFATAHPEIDRTAIVEGQRHLLNLINEAVSESTGQYARLQQGEAAGRLNDLQTSLENFKRLDRERAALIHQAVHDLRGNVQGVSSAAQVLREAGIPETERILFVNLLQQGTDAVSSMLADLMDLARLEAGQELREIAEFDPAVLLEEFATVAQPLAKERNLFLRAQGTTLRRVEGDAGMIRRIVQNLVLNALKYTHRGGVTLSWGEEGDASWWIKIEDTGPGILLGPGAPISKNMVEATDSARESDDAAICKDQKSSNVLPSPEKGAAGPSLPAQQQPGEGIGLSIVKRLCELLDASIELASSSQTGTVFRVVFPRSYAGL